MAKPILLDMHREGYVETIFNATNQQKRREGWVLKNKLWSPWFFNMRPVGGSPELVHSIACAMNYLVRDRIPRLDRLVGIEMAGVPLVSVVGTVQGRGCLYIPYAYTRPLPGGEKPRTPEKARELLANFKEGFEYGEKELVEGRIAEGETLCLVDDMVTDFGSKLIAKQIVEYDLARRGIQNVTMQDAAVVLDREQGGEKQAREAGMNLYSLIKFRSQGLGWLRDVMQPAEHDLISQYQDNPQRYQGDKGEGLREEALELARQYSRPIK